LPIVFVSLPIFFMILPIFFVSLTIVEASKKNILRLSRASPVPSWLFLELSPLASLVIQEIHQLTSTTKPHLRFRKPVKLFLCKRH
jgi:hypothetical protein